LPKRRAAAILRALGAAALPPARPAIIRSGIIRSGIIRGCVTPTEGVAIAACRAAAPGLRVCRSGTLADLFAGMVRAMLLTRDGGHVAVGSGTQATAARRSEAIGRPGLIDDPRFASATGRRRHRCTAERRLDFAPAR